jgi:hypothetical protein
MPALPVSEALQLIEPCRVPPTSVTFERTPARGAEVVGFERSTMTQWALKSPAGPESVPSKTAPGSSERVTQPVPQLPTGTVYVVPLPAGAPTTQPAAEPVTEKSLASRPVTGPAKVTL